METTKQCPCLEVTRVIVHVINDDMEFIRGVASIVLNNQLLLQGLRITEGVNGPHVVYSPKLFGMEDSGFRYDALTKELRNHIETAVLDAYGKACEMQKNEYDTAEETD